MSSKTNSRGVTLIEVMISLVILLIVFMGLIQASLLSINHNVRNEMRDEAVRVAAEYMSRTRSDVFSNLAALPPGFRPFPANPPVDPFIVTRNFRNIQHNYQVERQIESLDANTNRIAIRVSWWYPGDDTTVPFQQKPQHTIYYMMRNPVQ
jgi:prepilin-type N-terminal cleavage/methylation domain-containing protein